MKKARIIIIIDERSKWRRQRNNDLSGVLWDHTFLTKTEECWVATPIMIDLVLMNSETEAGTGMLIKMLCFLLTRASNGSCAPSDSEWWATTRWLSWISTCAQRRQSETRNECLQWCGRLIIETQDEDTRSNDKARVRTHQESAELLLLKQSRRVWMAYFWWIRFADSDAANLVPWYTKKNRQFKE